MGTTMGKPRPYESGSAEAEQHEHVTGETAEAYGVDTVIPVVVTDPVRIEDFPPRYVTTDQVPVNAVPARLVPAHRSRANVTIRAVGADIVIGSETVTIGTGFLIPAGTTFTVTASGAIFAVSTGPATAHVLAEHRDG